MNRILLLVLTLLVTIPLLLLRPVQMQEPNKPLPEKPLPNTADYPQAGASCKRKSRLHPWVGTPEVGTTGKYQCVLDLFICDATKSMSVSGVRDSAADMCADFWKVHDELRNREICCDKTDSAKCAEPKQAGPPWLDRPEDCKEFRETFPFIVQNPIYLPRGGPVNCKLVVEICGDKIIVEEKDLVAPDPRRTPPTIRGGFCKNKLWRFSLENRKVCCDQWHKAKQTAQPCNPTTDVDCDGIANASDRFVLDPQDTEFVLKTTLPNFPFDWSPNDLIPTHETCPNCKWELVGMTVTHVSLPGPRCVYRYRGQWLCPSRMMVFESEQKDKTVPGVCRS